MNFPFNFLKNHFIFDYYIGEDIKEEDIFCEMAFYECFEPPFNIKKHYIEVVCEEVIFPSKGGGSAGSNLELKRVDWKGNKTNDFFDFFDNPKKYYKMYNGFFSRTISQEDRYIVFQRQGWKCNFCNDRIKLTKKSTWVCDVGHIDHIHPFTKRKTYDNGMKNINEISNLQALCKNCNLSKKDKMIN